MRQLNNTENALFLLGGALLIIGAMAYVVLQQQWCVYAFALGTLLYVSMQMRQRYEGRNPVIRRLRRMMLLSDVLLFVAALLMIANKDNMLHLDHWIYIKYVHNNWGIALLIAALLQLYTTQRIDTELKKEIKKL